MQVSRIDVYVLRVPVNRPVRSAVGEYDNRPMVLIRIEDEIETVGWGEVFCNFPPCGAEHRARLIDTFLAPLVVGKSFSTPQDIFRLLLQKTEIVVIKSGEFGPFHQCIAGIDIAIWDIFARRKHLPLWRLIDFKGDPHLNVYASGLTPGELESIVERRFNEGYRAFKLKTGFGLRADLFNIKALRDLLGEKPHIMADANQVWNYEEAHAAVQAFAQYDLMWVEEPIRANRPIAEWQMLSERSPIDLALGECLYGEQMLLEMIESGVPTYLQPDVIKWGGVTGTLPVIRACVENEIQYCPHCFGGGISLLASAHLLASCGGRGWLEVNANNNPLQSILIDPFPKPQKESGFFPKRWDWAGNRIWIR